MDGLPEDVLAALHIPGVGNVLPVGDAGGFRAAKRRPTACGRSCRRKCPARGRRCPCDFPLRNRGLLAGRYPCAVAQHHPPRLTGVRDEGERHVRAVDRIAVFSIFGTARHRSRQRELDFPIGGLERARKLRPAGTRDRERPVGAERGGEESVGQWTRRDRRRPLRLSYHHDGRQCRGRDGQERGHAILLHGQTIPEFGGPVAALTAVCVDCKVWQGGNNSVVECDLAKVEVAGSNPVSRSNIYRWGPLHPN